jgi:uncharacterized protein (UPF0332 family)
MNPDEVKVMVSYRLEQAAETLQEADVLIKANCSTRGIINRSYYTMFYSVMALLQTIGQVPSKHVRAIGLFNKEFVRTGVFPKNLSEYLHRAFELRQKGDYHAGKPTSREKALEIFHQAEAFLRSIQAYLSEQGII